MDLRSLLRFTPKKNHNGERPVKTGVPVPFLGITILLLCFVLGAAFPPARAATIDSSPTASGTPSPSPTRVGVVDKVTKFGLGVYAGGGHIMQGLQRAKPTIILIHDPDPGFARATREMFPKAFIIGRRTIVDQPLDRPGLRGAQIADYVAETAVPLKGVIDAWQSYNEPLNTGDYEGYKAYNEFQIAFAERLQGYYGIPAVGGNDAPGSVQPYDYPKYFAGAIRASEYWGIHAYAADRILTLRTPDAEWYALRYRKIHDELEKAGIHNTKFVLTETGLWGGWRGRVSDRSMAEDLMWLSDELNKDPYVIGQTAFGLFGNGLWPEYDMLIGSDILDILGTYKPKGPILTPNSILPRIFIPAIVKDLPLPPTPTPTETATPTETSTPTPTETPTVTSTPTETATVTATSTRTATPTITSTPQPTVTPTPTSTPLLGIPLPDLGNLPSPPSWLRWPLQFR